MGPTFCGIKDVDFFLLKYCTYTKSASVFIMNNTILRGS